MSHWTNESNKAFRFKIVTDFIIQLEKKMEQVGFTNKELADSIGVTKGRISQILNNPGNMTLDLMVRCARAVGLKLSTIAYDDDDGQNNERGPINAEVFRVCWENAGKPQDMWSTAKANPTVIMVMIASRETGNPYEIRGLDYKGEIEWQKQKHSHGVMQNLSSYLLSTRASTGGIGASPSSLDLVPVMPRQ